MSRAVKIALAAAVALAGTLGVGAASAMPALGLQTAVATAADAVHVDKVRLICPPYRPCYYVPGPYGNYRPYYRPYGYGFYRPYGYRYGRGFY